MFLRRGSRLVGEIVPIGSRYPMFPEVSWADVIAAEEVSPTQDP